MGQYFYIVNIDRGEFLHPHRFGFSLKFGEVQGFCGPMHGLTYLICENDPPAYEPLFGSWVGDRIVFAGDYSPARLDLFTDSDDGTSILSYPALVGSLKHDGGDDMNVYNIADSYFTDISKPVREMMKRQSDWLAEEMRKIEQKKTFFFDEEE